MKIVDAKINIVENPFPRRGGSHWNLVKLTTDTGIEGWGEMWWNRLSPDTYVPVVKEIIDRFFIGSSPSQIELLFQRFFKDYLWQHVDLTQFGIFSGLEAACWDIVGKEAGKPVHELLGGLVNDRLRSYTYIYPEDPLADHRQLWADPKACAKRARHYADQGFTALKLDPVDQDIEGISPPWHVSLPVLNRAERTIASIREAVGPDVDIIIGTHGQYTAASAIRFIKRMEKYDPLWFEEPTPPEEPEQMAKVNRATSVPIAAGERLATKHELALLITIGAADILQVDLGGIGGILEGKKVAGMAEAFHLQVTPHFWAGPIMYAAQAQLSACSPNFMIQEVIERMDGFHQELVTTPFEWAGGAMEVSKLPGLGVEVNEAAVRKHSVTTV